jgi:hypothetical protein
MWTVVIEYVMQFEKGCLALRCIAEFEGVQRLGNGMGRVNPHGLQVGYR